MNTYAVHAIRPFVRHVLCLRGDKNKCRSSSGLTFTGRLEVCFFSVLSPARKTWRPWLHEACSHSTICPFTKSSIYVHGASRVLFEKLIVSHPVKKFPTFMAL